MGIFYSMMEYLYGKEGEMIKVTQTKIIISTSRMVKYLRIKQQKLQIQTKLIQKHIIGMISSQNKFLRNADGEIKLFQQVLYKGQLFAAYQEIINCSNTIRSQANSIQKGTQVSQKCLIAICTIIYSYEHLNLKQCLKIQQIFPKPYPQIKIEQISVPLRQYVNRKQFTSYQINLYILQMCSRHKLSLQKVNQAGHNFVYSPKNIDFTKSSEMFAMSFDGDLNEQFVRQQQEL